MSNNDSIDEETKRILAEADSDDSKESKPVKKDKKDDGIEWETFDYEKDDDRNW